MTKTRVLSSVLSIVARHIPLGCLLSVGDGNARTRRKRPCPVVIPAEKIVLANLIRKIPKK